MSNGDVTLRFSDISELDSSIQKLADAAGSTVREVLPAQMRLFAADLAFNTRPIGKTAAAQKDGQKKVEDRIRWVYASVGMMADLLGRKEERLKKASYRSSDIGNAMNSPRRLVLYENITKNRFPAFVKITALLPRNV